MLERLQLPRVANPRQGHDPTVPHDGVAIGVLFEHCDDCRERGRSAELSQAIGCEVADSRIGIGQCGDGALHGTIVGERSECNQRRFSHRRIGLDGQQLEHVTCRSASTAALSRRNVWNWQRDWATRRPVPTLNLD